MRIVTSYIEFFREVKIVQNWWRLRDMGLVCRTSLLGTFIPSETDGLKSFCEYNSKFHIVSFGTNFFAWNRYHPDGDSFYLAEGNSDPNLLLDWRVESEDLWEEWCQNGFSLAVPGE